MQCNGAGTPGSIPKRQQYDEQVAIGEGCTKPTMAGYMVGTEIPDLTPFAPPGLLAFQLATPTLALRSS